MREQIMANRMKYLRTIMRNLRAEISANELIINPRLIHLFQAVEYQLRELEMLYAGESKTQTSV